MQFALIPCQLVRSDDDDANCHFKGSKIKVAGGQSFPENDDYLAYLILLVNQK